MITLEANYTKKIGLPGYSSHQFSVTVRTEISDPGQIAAESSRLYSVLQANVDREIQRTGFHPGAATANGKPAATNGNGHGYRNGTGTNHTSTEVWSCTPKQQNLILGLVEEHHIEKAEVEALAQQLFRKGVRQLNKLEASGLIDELIAQHGGKGNGNGNGNGRPATAGGRR